MTGEKDVKRPTTNNPISTAAIFITYIMAYPATAPNRNHHLQKI